MKAVLTPFDHTAGNRVYARRRRTNTVVRLALWTATALAILPLLAIVAHLMLSGASELSPALVFRSPVPVGTRGGGLANGIAGTLILVSLAALIGAPIGVAAGLFLAERHGTRLARFIRFIADVLSGLPSIVLGIFAWELIVRPTGRFSAIAGSVALGALIIPLIARASEEMVRLVPTALREAALALGFSHWRTSLTIVLHTAMPGVLTAVLVSLARAAGETAPLLFTALGNAYWSLDPTRPIAALPLQIFSYAQSPYDEQRAQAWAGALLLIVLIAIFSLIAQGVLRARHRLLHAAPRRSGDD